MLDLATIRRNWYNSRRIERSASKWLCHNESVPWLLTKFLEVLVSGEPVLGVNQAKRSISVKMIKKEGRASVNSQICFNAEFNLTITSFSTHNVNSSSRVVWMFNSPLLHRSKWYRVPTSSATQRLFVAVWPLSLSCKKESRNQHFQHYLLL